MVRAGGARLAGYLVHKTTGQPLIGAPVKLDNKHFAVTDEKGRFVFVGLRPGKHRIKVDDPECAPFEASFELKANQAQLELRYALDPRGGAAVEEVIIRSERLVSEVSDTVLEMDEVMKIPGTQGDVLKIVQSLPGVARNLAMGGSGGPGIVVRGAAPEDSKVLIDGFVVPILYHFGGLKSIFNSDMLKRIDFLPGGFGAEYGRAIGGIVDVQTRPCDHKQLDGYVELSMLDAGFFLRGPVTEDLGFFVAARRSTVDLWLPYVLPDDAGFDMTVAPVYYDYQAKVDWSPTVADRFSIMAFGSSDELKFLMEQPKSMDPELRGDFGMVTSFHRVHLGWTHAPPAANWHLKVRSVAGFDSAQMDMAEKFYLHIEVPSLGLRSDLDWQFAKGWHLTTGLIGGFASYDLEHKIPMMPKEGQVPSKLQSFELFEGREQTQAITGGAYTSLGWEPFAGTRLTGGLRLDVVHADEVDEWALMPRFSLKHELRPGTIFKAGVGLYYQMPTEDELSSNFGNSDLEMERAWHYTLGLEQKLPFSSSVDFTFFYKTLDKLVVPDTATNYSNGGVGKVAGLEVLLRRDMREGLFGWLAYTLMRSQRQDGPDELWRLFSYDQTHILTLVAGYRLPTGPIEPAHGQRDGWEFGARFQLVSGNPNTPIVGGIYDADWDNYLPIPGPINSERLPTYHRLDMRVDYTWAFSSWALSLYLDVQNAYNHASIEGIRYNYDYSERAYFEGLPILPALGVRGSF
ncbi:MAG: TonB-dependent receptor [Deltaproteobacteria bacterium]|nr:TonB-dependent receptor [Deltaproteobacteria bacterium]